MQGSFWEKPDGKATQPKIHCADPSERMTRVAPRILVALLSISREKVGRGHAQKRKQNMGKVLPYPWSSFISQKYRLLGKGSRREK